jgi:2-aminoadipate transaminase
LADRYGFLVVEDDAYRLLPFDAEPPAPVAAHTDRAAHLGTFSKILSPGLRVGWLTAPRPVLAAVARAKQAADLHTSTFAQAILREAAADAQRLRAHVGAVRRLYRGRAQHLVTALTSAFGGRLSIGVPAGGMFCWAEFLDGTDTSALLPLALQHGVAFVPGTAFSVAGGRRQALRLCFASVPEPALDEGVRRLAAAVPVR